MPVTDLATAIGSSLLSGQNSPSLPNNIFSYPGANNVGASVPMTPWAANGMSTGNTPPAAAVAPPGPTAAQIAAANTAAANARAATAINAGYKGVLDTYNGQLSDIPGEIADAGSLVNNQADSQNKSIESAYGVGNSNLAFARNQVNTQGSRAITKLGQQLRDSFSSYDTLVGNAGAGDSSAPDQLSYALQKVGAQGRTDINNNTADQQGAITQQQTGLDATHADQLQQLGTWKANQIVSIGQQFRQLQQQIETAKAGATKDQLVALAGLNTDAVNQAVAALSGVKATHQQGVAAISASLKALQAPGDASKLSAVTYAPTAAPTPAAPTFAASSDPGASFDAGAVPYFKKLATA